MESDEKMILRDMPVETRNYMIIDNITGKPIDQSNYTLSIDTEVIGKLNKLKKINEEKIKQASLREQYGDSNIASTFTPDNNIVFTPVYNDEYIDYQDFNKDSKKEKVEEPVVEEVKEIKPQQELHAEVIKSDTLLDRVVARDPSLRAQAKAEEEKKEEPQVELDYISNYTPEVEEEKPEISADNSLFTPDDKGLLQASEQILKIDPKKLGGDIKSKEEKKGTENIKLEKMEVISGKAIAWTAYILFFIPLLIKRRNRFVRIHANEGLGINILEILSAIMIGQYFLLPKFIENISDKFSMISFIICTVGIGLLGACIIGIISGIVSALLGNQSQRPWFFGRRIIHVPTERVVD